MTSTTGPVQLPPSNVAWPLARRIAAAADAYLAATDELYGAIATGADRARIATRVKERDAARRTYEALTEWTEEDPPGGEARAALL